MAKHLLLTRPYDDCANTARELEAACHHRFSISFCPIMTINDMRSAPFSGNADSIIFTSIHAATRFTAQGAELAGHVVIYCIGQRVANHIRSFFPHNPIQTYPVVVDMLTALSQIAPRRIVYYRGRHITHDIMPILLSHGHDVSEAILYDAVAIESLPDDAVALMKKGGVDLIAFYSRRTALHFVTLAKDAQLLPHLKHITALCISPTVLECVHTYFSPHSESSASPNGDGMIALTARHINV